MSGRVIIRTSPGMVVKRDCDPVSAQPSSVTESLRYKRMSRMTGIPRRLGSSRGPSGSVSGTVLHAQNCAVMLAERGRVERPRTVHGRPYVHHFYPPRPGFGFGSTSQNPGSRALERPLAFTCSSSPVSLALPSHPNWQSRRHCQELGDAFDLGPLAAGRSVEASILHADHKSSSRIAPACQAAEGFGNGVGFVSEYQAHRLTTKAARPRAPGPVQTPTVQICRASLSGDDAWIASPGLIKGDDHEPLTLPRSVCDHRMNDRVEYPTLDSPDYVEGVMGPAPVAVPASMSLDQALAAAT